MIDYTWIANYTVLDKSRAQIIKDLEIQPEFYPYIDVAKKRIQELVDSLGQDQDAADRFLEFLEEEYEYVEIVDE
jgi:hypothetical protein